MTRKCLALLLALATGCAYTAPSQAGKGRKALLFKIGVEGQFLASNPDVTYYVVFNSPTVPPSDQLVGPRFNGPDVRRTKDFIDGRLPFIYQLLNDLPSTWTDFYFFQGTPTGTGRVGRGTLRDGLPVILDEDYSRNLWNIGDAGKTLNLTIFLDQLSVNTNPSVIGVNLGVGDSINTGWGMIFDRWKNNVPFQLPISPTQQQDLDISPATLINVPTRPMTQLPPGATPADVNITKWEARAAE